MELSRRVDPSRAVEGKARSGAAGRSRYSIDNVRRNTRLDRRFAISGLAYGLWKDSGERSSFDAVGFCGRALGYRVPIMTDGRSFWPSQVAQCGRVWVCPVCCAKIKARRAVEIERICASHVAAGGTLSMLTATVRHDRSMALVDVRRAVGDSWRKVQRLKSWALLRSVLVGQIVAPEVTVGENGWHPHLHVLLCLRPGVEQVELNALLAGFRDDWLRLVNESLGVSPSVERAVHLLHFGSDASAAAAGYLSKVAKELTAGEMKSGRDPFSLADRFAEGDAQAVARWIEYAAAMKGCRSVAFSSGLRELYAVEVLDEVELLEDDESVGTEICFVSGWNWNLALRDGVLVALLEEIEAAYRSGSFRDFSP